MNAYFPSLYSGKYLPQRCASKEMPGGQNVSPVVSWGDVPRETESFVLTIVDRHPSRDGWVCWYVVNIPATARGIPEKASTLREKLPQGCLETRNSLGDLGYAGPIVPAGSEPHPIELTVYALSVPSLLLGPYAKPEERAQALEGKILATAKTTALLTPGE
jgi:Raf kinase inhibitor-like YbhB/YbcL family protein